MLYHVLAVHPYAPSPGIAPEAIGSPHTLEVVRVHVDRLLAIPRSRAAACRRARRAPEGGPAVLHRALLARFHQREEHTREGRVIAPKRAHLRPLSYTALTGIDIRIDRLLRMPKFSTRPRAFEADGEAERIAVVDGISEGIAIRIEPARDPDRGFLRVESQHAVSTQDRRGGPASPADELQRLLYEATSPAVRSWRRWPPYPPRPFHTSQRMGNTLSALSDASLPRNAPLGMS